VPIAAKQFPESRNQRQLADVPFDPDLPETELGHDLLDDFVPTKSVAQHKKLAAKVPKSKIEMGKGQHVNHWAQRCSTATS
jgi:hypothetical protein